MVDICAALGGVLLANAKLADDVQSGAEAIVGAIRDGRAAERFGQMVAAMGGPLQFTENWGRFLPEATVIREVTAKQTGYISAINGEVLGLAVVALGGGRRVETDKINPAVGFSDIVRLGAKVTRGQPLGVVHAGRPDKADAAEFELRKAITISAGAAVTPPDLIVERIG